MGGSGHSLHSKTAFERPAVPLISENRRFSLALHSLICDGKDVFNPFLYASIRLFSFLAIACFDFCLNSLKNILRTCKKKASELVKN